jgi:hypothetical protein
MIETQYSQVHPVLHVDLVYIILYTCTNVNTHKHIVPLAIAFTILQTAIFGENSGICKTGTQQPFEPWTSAAEFQNTVPYSVLQVDNSLRRPPAAWRAGAGWPGRPATPTPRRRPGGRPPALRALLGPSWRTSAARDSRCHCRPGRCCHLLRERTSAPSSTRPTLTARASWTRTRCAAWCWRARGASLRSSSYATRWRRWTSVRSSAAIAAATAA